MEVFYVDVVLSQGLTRVQVDEVPPEQWDFPIIPLFIVEYYDGRQFTTLTLQLEFGRWYDRNSRLRDEDDTDSPLKLSSQNLNYHSPLDNADVQSIGTAISRHMAIYLTSYLGLFAASFPSPTLN